MKQGSDGVLLWRVPCRNGKGKHVLEEVIWDIRMDSCLTVIE